MPTQLTILDPVARPILEASGLRTYEDYLAAEIGELVHKSATTCTRRLRLAHEGRTNTYYLKTHTPRTGRLLGGILDDKCGREVKNYALLRRRCRVNVPDVVAHGRRTRFWKALDGFILTRGVPNSTPLDRFVSDRWPDAASTTKDPEKQALLYSVANLVAQMHSAGFCHIDLQWRNLLVSQNGDGQQEIVVIDSSRGGLRHWSARVQHGRIRDLSSLYKEARLKLTAGEQLRWLRRYLGARKLAPEHRALIRTIQYDRTLKDHGEIA